MKIQARSAYTLTLTLGLGLGPLAGCGDDAESSEETMAMESTSDSSSTSAAETTVTEVESSSGADDDSGSSSSSGADDDSGSSSGSGDPFAGCSRDVLESDLSVFNAIGMPGAPQWYGPGADADGALVDDGETQYIVSATYLALKPDADFDAFTQLNVANSMALYGNPGMVAIQLGFSMECVTARTFTVWESEEALMEFVGSDAHLQSVSAFPALSRGGSTLSVWPEPVTASEITWEAALVRMTDETAYD